MDYFGKTPVDLIRDSLDQCTAIPGNTKCTRRQGIERVDLEARYQSLGMEQRSHRTLDLLRSTRTEFGSEYDGIPPKRYSSGEVEVILMSVVVNRCINQTDRDFGLLLQKAQHPAELDDEFDWRYLTGIAIVPSAGVFYSLLRKHPTTKQLIAMPLSWLRMKRNVVLKRNANGTGDGILPPIFAKGGYVKGVAHDQIYNMWMKMRDIQIPDVENINCIQLPLGENTHFLPDYYVNNVGDGEFVGDENARKARYEMEVEESKTMGKGKRQYLKGALYNSLPQDCLILDVKRDRNIITNFDLTIGIQRRGKDMDKKNRDTGDKRKGKVSIQEESTVEIRYEDPTESYDLDDLQQLCQHATELCNQQVRKSGDLGNMYAFGQRFDEYHKVLTQFASNKKVRGVTRNSDLLGLLATTSEGVLKQTTRHLPSVTRLLQDAEREVGIPQCPTMGGPGRERFLSNTLFISEDLANAVHQDVNDGCKCICIWRETHDGWAQNWYFVLPDVVVQYPFTLENGEVVMKTYQGIAVRLYDGIMISWDGRIVRHGTTVTRPVPKSKEGRANHTYGCVYVAKQSVIDFWNNKNKDDKNREGKHDKKGDSDEKENESKRNKRRKDC